MLSDKSRHVLWTVAIDNQKCQNFRILYEDDCPGWKIKPIGLERVYIHTMNMQYIYVMQFFSASYSYGTAQR